MIVIFFPFISWLAKCSICSYCFIFYVSSCSICAYYTLSGCICSDCPIFHALLPVLCSVFYILSGCSSEDKEYKTIHIRQNREKEPQLAS